jgi:hypothetical protein
VIFRLGRYPDLTEQWTEFKRALASAHAYLQQLEEWLEAEMIELEFEAWQPEAGTTIH